MVLSMREGVGLGVGAGGSYGGCLHFEMYSLVDAISVLKCCQRCGVVGPAHSNRLECCDLKICLESWLILNHKLW